LRIEAATLLDSLIKLVHAIKMLGQKSVGIHSTHHQQLYYYYYLFIYLFFNQLSLKGEKRVFEQVESENICCEGYQPYGDNSMLRGETSHCLTWLYIYIFFFSSFCIFNVVTLIVSMENIV